MSKRWILICTFGLISACSDQECSSDASKLALTYCIEVFDGQYQACSGPTWNDSRIDQCDEYDGYELSLELIISPESSAVVESVRVDAVEPHNRKLQDFHADILIVNEAEREVCFDVAEPPVCMKAENPLANLPASDVTRPHRNGS